MMTDREALKKIQTLLKEFEVTGEVGGLVEHNENLITEALAIADGVLAQESAEAKRLSELSWRNSPDRSGGQFTQDEINNASRWI